ncbi:hypothetical protein EW093_00780 [Thiospirochaeta perfilievii]|uniref:PLD phosphodiesterase domain-containing protein n=1 Tax=Thiospirochaeta perfilievii TaxID=252967 RepID=A0A5C1Q8K7_9SPIO|nr:phospholipase D family protein [Thiospirochaeta perfilievii]QEN03299.1 hypothetical protein EW093_00780 [Thiospirochaeta perfilievii]
MLRSSNITTYTDILTPPEGYETEQALGLTFSMDLTMVLACAVSLFLSKEILEDIKGERYDVITALSEAKEKLRIYGHYGRIKVPETFSPVFTLLEPCIKSVRNKKGSFHPKVWLIKFNCKNSNEKIYRLIVMSKNITDTNNWDVTYHADGKIKTGNYNESLITFLNSFTHDSKDKKFISNIVKELEQVQFKNPDDISKVLFHGFPNDNFSFPNKMQNTVIISPFLSEEKLTEIKNCSDGVIYLLSKDDALNKINTNTLDKFKCYTLKDEIIDGLSLLDEITNNDINNLIKMDLHAKCYLWEKGSHTHIILGSNNCTNSAFSQNQEAAIEMVAHRDKIKIENILETLIDNTVYKINDYKDKEEEIKLFSPYIRSDEIIKDDSENIKQADQIRRLLEVSPLSGIITKDKESDSYTIEFTSNLSIPDKYSNWCVEVALVTNKSVKKILDKQVLFDNLELDSLTSFIIISIKNKDYNKYRYLVKVEYKNYSDYFSKMENRIVSEIFNSTNKLINYITWLLQCDPESSNDLPIFVETSEGFGSKNGVEFNIPLYESLILVAAKEPKKLQKIDHVISILESNNNIPEDELKIIEQFWKPFKKYIKGIK